MAAKHSPPHNIAFFLTSINGAVYFVAFVLKIVTVFQPKHIHIEWSHKSPYGNRQRISAADLRERTRACDMCWVMSSIMRKNWTNYFHITSQLRCASIAYSKNRRCDDHSAIWLPLPHTYFSSKQNSQQRNMLAKVVCDILNYRYRAQNIFAR